MEISAILKNAGGDQVVTVAPTRSDGCPFQPRDLGSGSAVNGGELLMLALAICYCNLQRRSSPSHQVGCR